MRIALALLVLVMACPLATAQTMDLIYAPEPGEPLEYTTLAAGSIDIGAIGQENLPFRIQYLHTVQVLESTEDGILHEIVLGAVDATLGGQALESKGEGVRATTLIDGRGLIADVPERIADGVLGDADDLATMLLSLHDLALPAGEASVGDTWEIVVEDGPSITETPEGMEVTDTTTYTVQFVSLEDGVATLYLELQGEADADGTTITAAATIDMEIDVETWTLQAAGGTFDINIESVDGAIHIHDLDVEMLLM